MSGHKNNAAKRDGTTLEFVRVPVQLGVTTKDLPDSELSVEPTV